MSINLIIQKAWGLIPPYDILFYTVLSFAVPLVIYKANRWLHKVGDPPWKTPGDEGNPEK